tara:strand:- start:3785 stop:3982 length:198 start_codon:yes stop_codon:yes gene_type:complete
MNSKVIQGQIADIDEHILYLGWRCENTVNHSEIKKMNKTIKGLNKTRVKLSKKLSNDRNEHDQIT